MAYETEKSKASYSARNTPNNRSYNNNSAVYRVGIPQNFRAYRLRNQIEAHYGEQKQAYNQRFQDPREKEADEALGKYGLRRIGGKTVSRLVCPLCQQEIGIAA